MNIKMPIKFHGNYVLTIRSGDSQSRERCQKLTVREFTEEETLRASEKAESREVPTHLITFTDFGCRRIIEGKIKLNEDERLVFQVEDKEYEFSPYQPNRAKS